jgi:hypothetical protein
VAFGELACARPAPDVYVEATLSFDERGRVRADLDRAEDAAVERRRRRLREAPSYPGLS